MKLQITNQRIEVLDASLVVSGSVRQYECECVFSEDWDGYGKTAVFKPLSGSTYEASIVNGKCIIPYAAISNDGYLLIGVYGTVGTGDSYKRRPTVWTDAIRVEEGCNEGIVVPDPTQSVYDQIMAAIAKVESDLAVIVPQAKEQADKAKTEADKAASSASSAASSKASVDSTVASFTVLANEKSAEITTKTNQGVIALEAKKVALSGQLEALETELAGSLTTQGTTISAYLDEKKTELEADLETKEAALEESLESKEASLETSLENKESSLETALETKETALEETLDESVTEYISEHAGELGNRDFFFTPGDGTTLEQVKAAIMAGKRACFLGTYTDDEGCTSTVLMSCSVCGNAETKYGGFFFLGREDFYEYFVYRSASNWDKPVSLSRYPSRDLQYMIEGLHTIGYVKYLVNENILPVLAFTDPVSGEFNLVPYTAADDNCVIFEGILRGKIYRAVAAGSDDDKLDFVVTQTPIVDPNTKVDKVAGKGLSSNDFTNALKSKLDGIDMSAKVDKSDTSVYDSASGGVSVQIQGTTKTVASQTDFTAQKQKIESLKLYRDSDGFLCEED